MNSDSLFLPPSRNAGNDPAESQVALDALDPFESILSIEGTAVQYGLLPVELPREACTADAEAHLRVLGRLPATDAPWLPVSSVGPLLVMAHYDPRCEDSWGVPEHLRVNVVISKEQYEGVRKDLVMRIGAHPLPGTNEVEWLQAPALESGDLQGAMTWFLEHYPMPDTERNPLVKAYEDLLNRVDQPEIEDFNGLQEHLGVALQAMSTRGPKLIFNPEEAPRQSKFPPALLEKHGVFPVYCSNNRVYLLSDHADTYLFEDEWLSEGNDPIEIHVVLADASAIRRTIARNSTNSTDLTVEIDESSYEISDDANLVEIIPEDVMAVDPRNPNTPAEDIIKWVLFSALQSRASDLHLEKYFNTVRFRARVDGELRVIFNASEEFLTRYIAIVKNYANLGQSRQQAQDGRFGMAIGKRRVDVRVAAVPCRGEFQKVILRFLDKDGGMKSMGDLHLSERQADYFERAMARDQGLILVTGPTGSGKTTTLYALLNSVNEDNINLHTIEDPIEYRIEGINQTQTDPVNNISFATGLRALLRSDPDVILIGECRDEETATAAVTSAMTGHLVLTTLHANDSLRAISRILSMGVPNYLLADSLVLSQAQRLVRSICKYCKRPQPWTDPMRQIFIDNGLGDQLTDAPLYVGAGCAECHQTGYSGRIALMELAEINSTIKDMISDGVPMSEIRGLARKNGLLSLYQEGLLQVLAGRTTLEEIRGLAY